MQGSTVHVHTKHGLNIVCGYYDRIYLYRVVTTRVDPIVHGEVIQSPNMRGKQVGDLPLGNGLEGAVHHLGQLEQWCPCNQLK